MRVTVFSLERLNSSTNGNPRFKVNTSEGSFNTASDHGVAYMIQNGWRGKDSREADIEVNRRGLITDLTYVDGDN